MYYYKGMRYAVQILLVFYYFACVGKIESCITINEFMEVWRNLDHEVIGWGGPNTILGSD